MSEYYLRFRIRVSGPYSDHEMRNMIAEGRLTPLHLISKDKVNWLAMDQAEAWFQTGAVAGSQRPLPDQNTVDITTLHLSPEQAMTGMMASVETKYGAISVEIPPGIMNGQSIRLKNAIPPSSPNAPHGDLLFRVVIEEANDIPPPGEMGQIAGQTPPQARRSRGFIKEYGGCVQAIVIVAALVYGGVWLFTDALSDWRFQAKLLPLMALGGINQLIEQGRKKKG